MGDGIASDKAKKIISKMNELVVKRLPAGFLGRYVGVGNQPVSPEKEETLYLFWKPKVKRTVGPKNSVYFLNTVMVMVSLRFRYSWILISI